MSVCVCDNSEDTGIPVREESTEMGLKSKDAEKMDYVVQRHTHTYRTTQDHLGQAHSQRRSTGGKK